jgi:serine/threonine-protein phosphatase 2B regulatory subunit
LVFRIYDVDNDGFVGQDDLFYIFKFVTCSNMSDSQLEVMVDRAFAKMDDSGDRKVNLAEFTDYLGDSAAHEFLEIDFQ